MLQFFPHYGNFFVDCISFASSDFNLGKLALFIDGFFSVLLEALGTLLVDTLQFLFHHANHVQQF